MYNKLFTKILDSSIWLAPDPIRLVWITFLAVMDEDGHVFFASYKNVAARARVTEEQAKEAILAFENPDPDSGDPDNEGRRIERIPGGWLVLNAEKYRLIITKAIQRENTRQRVAAWRQNKKNVTNSNDDVQNSNVSVTPSESYSESVSRSDKDKKRFAPPSIEEVTAFFTEKGHPKEAQKFFNFYDSKGWMVGKNKMQKWKSAASGWIARNPSTTNSLPPELRNAN